MTNSIEAIRNLAFVGHPSSGKTTLVDALAHLTGATPRKGSVADRSSICDTEPEEQDKQHTLEMAIVHAEHGNRSWTFMDTPGYPEFIGDVRAAMWASEMVVGVASCSSGVTYNLRNKLEVAAEMGRGRAIVITHVDGENADFDEIVDQLRERVGEICVPFLLPDASGPGFSAVKPILAEDSEWRSRLMDRVMDSCEDEEVLERYLETETLSDEDLRSRLPVAIAAGTLVPVLACNPESGLGLEQVLGFLTDFAPDPGRYEQQDRDGQAVALDPEGEVAAAVFNLKSDPHVGRICTIKMLRGTLHASDQVVGGEAGGKGQKLGGLFHPVGARRDAIETAKPGEIVSFSKVEVSYGDGIAVAGHDPLQLPVPAPFTPMVSMAVFPKSRADEQKIGEALNKLSAEDVSLRTEFDPETRELLVRGMSDLHLQVVESRLKRRFGVEIEVRIPRISYRETITRSSEGHHRHKKQTGGRGQFGECYLRMKPLAKGAGVVFQDKVVGGSIPRNLIPAVEKGIREQASQGILTSSKVVDLEVEVYDGKFHQVDSDEASFKMAGSRAFVEGFNKAGPVILEPIVEMCISIPTEHAGAVFSDITSQRRGHVLDQWNEAGGAITVVKAHVPLSMVQTYQRDLKSQTAGEGSYGLELVDYAAVPGSEQARIVAAEKKRDEG